MLILPTLKNVLNCILQPIATDYQNLEGHTMGIGVQVDASFYLSLGIHQWPLSRDEVRG